MSKEEKSIFVIYPKALKNTLAEQSAQEQKIRESLPEHKHKTPLMIQAQFVNTLMEMTAAQWQLDENIQGTLDRLKFEVAKYKKMSEEEKSQSTFTSS